LDLSLPRPAIIEGVISRHDGTPLGGVTVTAVPAQGCCARSTTTNSAGAYAVGELVPGSYQMLAGLEGYPAAYYTPGGGTTDPTEAATLTLQDGQRLSGISWSLTSNRPPAASGGGPYSVAEGGTVILSGSGTDPDGDALAYTWDLDNDGTYETTGPTATFSAEGRDGPSSHRVALRVCDDKGACATSPAPRTVDYWSPRGAGAQLDTQAALLQRYQQLHPGAAEERVGAGDPEALAETDQPVPGPFAAGAYLEKYGPHGRYDWPLLLERLRVPWLAILGGADPSPLAQAAVEAVRGTTRTPPGCEVRGVPHWRHGLELPDEGVPAASAQLVAGWWERLGPCARCARSLDRRRLTARSATTGPASRCAAWRRGRRPDARRVAPPASSLAATGRCPCGAVRQRCLAAGVPDDQPVADVHEDALPRCCARCARRHRLPTRCRNVGSGRHFPRQVAAS
jgi:hypothetical protein